MAGVATNSHHARPKVIPWRERLLPLDWSIGKPPLLEEETLANVEPPRDVRGRLSHIVGSRPFQTNAYDKRKDPEEHGALRHVDAQVATRAL